MQYNYEPFFDLELNSNYNTFYNNFKENLYHEHNYREQEINDDPVKDEEYEEWINGEKLKGTKFFQTEYRQFVKDGTYFYGCPHELYLKTYADRLDSFMRDYPEANEMQFIKSELEKGIRSISYFISEREKKNMSFSLGNRYNYLVQRSSQLGYKITLSPGEKYADNTFKIIKNPSNPIKKKEHLVCKTVKWGGSNAQAAEFIKGLIECNVLPAELSEKEIFERFSCFLDLKIKQTIGIRDFSKRADTGGNLTLFLDKQKDALWNWHNRKEEKKRNN